MPLIPLTKMENLLAEAGGAFVQVHRSFLVSEKGITAVRPNSITIQTFEIPIGIQFREQFFKRIGMRDAR